MYQVEQVHSYKYEAMTNTP